MRIIPFERGNKDITLPGIAIKGPGLRRARSISCLFRSYC
jgi:hypothetical protein